MPMHTQCSPLNLKRHTTQGVACSARSLQIRGGIRWLYLVLIFVALFIGVSASGQKSSGKITMKVHGCSEGLNDLVGSVMNGDAWEEIPDSVTMETLAEFFSTFKKCPADTAANLAKFYMRKTRNSRRMKALLRKCIKDYAMNQQDQQLADLKKGVEDLIAQKQATKKPKNKPTLKRNDAISNTSSSSSSVSSASSDSLSSDAGESIKPEQPTEESTDIEFTYGITQTDKEMDDFMTFDIQAIGTTWEDFIKEDEELADDCDWSSFEEAYVRGAAMDSSNRRLASVDTHHLTGHRVMNRLLREIEAAKLV